MANGLTFAKQDSGIKEKYGHILGFVAMGSGVFSSWAPPAPGGPVHLPNVEHHL